MKIFLVCSRHLYSKVEKIKKELELMGHQVTLPNNCDDPDRENRMKEESPDDYPEWKSKMFEMQNEKIKSNDAIFVLNYDKGEKKNYIGGSTFLEMFKAWELGKKIFMMNPYPKNILEDEIKGFQPKIINEDLSKLN